MEKFKKNIFTEDINEKSTNKLEIPDKDKISKNRKLSVEVINASPDSKSNRRLKQLTTAISAKKLNIPEIQRITWSGIPFGMYLYLDLYHILTFHYI
jgi:hypothetical protein